MSTSRHCDFFPTPQGWYMNLAPNEYDNYEDSTTYGPTNTLREIHEFLDNFSNPGSSCTSQKIAPVPTKSPNGDPVEKTRPARSRHTQYGAPAPRYSAGPNSSYDHYIYDHETDLTFAIKPGNTPVVEAVYGGYFWHQKQTVPFSPVAIKGNAEQWSEFSKKAAAAFLAGGGKYAPVIIPNLPNQPLTLEELTATSKL